MRGKKCWGGIFLCPRTLWCDCCIVFTWNKRCLVGKPPLIRNVCVNPLRLLLSMHMCLPQFLISFPAFVSVLKYVTKCIPSEWWLLLLSIRLPHGKAGTMWYQVKTFTCSRSLIQLVPLFPAIGTEPMSMLYFICSVNSKYNAWLPGTLLELGLLQWAIRKQNPLRMLHHLSGVWEETTCKINPLHNYIRKFPILWEKQSKDGHSKC